MISNVSHCLTFPIIYFASHLLFNYPKAKDRLRTACSNSQDLSHHETDPGMRVFVVSFQECGMCNANCSGVKDGCVTEFSNLFQPSHGACSPWLKTSLCNQFNNCLFRIYTGSSFSFVCKYLTVWTVGQTTDTLKLLIQ